MLKALVKPIQIYVSIYLSDRPLSNRNQNSGNDLTEFTIKGLEIKRNFIFTRYTTPKKEKKEFAMLQLKSEIYLIKTIHFTCNDFAHCKISAVVDALRMPSLG
jgi:hypothetical protein